MATSNCDDAAKPKQELHNLYVRAENIMLKPEGARPLEKFLPEIDRCYEKLIEACDAELNRAPDTDWC